MRLFVFVTFCPEFSTFLVEASLREAPALCRLPNESSLVCEEVKKPSLFSSFPVSRYCLRGAETFHARCAILRIEGIVFPSFEARSICADTVLRSPLLRSPVAEGEVNFSFPFFLQSHTV